MNKVFRVIWNHATQTWVAVSELAKAKGKTKSKTSKLTAFSVALGSTLAAGSVMAATSATLTGTISPSSNGIVHLGNGKTEVHATTDSSVSAPKNIIVIGDKDVNVFDQQIYIGFNSRNGQANGKAGDTIIGNRVDFGGGANGQDSFSTAVGFGTQVAGPSVAIGVGARSDPLDSSGWNATTNGGVAIGAFALQGGNINGGTVIGALSSGDYHYATSIGALSGITNTFVDKATNKGYTLQEGGGATNIRVAQASVGYKAGARGARSVAIANCATTGVAHTTAGTGAVAIGDQSKAFKDASIAIGQQAIAGGVTSAEITALNAEVTRIQGLLDNANATLATAVTNMNADQSADNKFNVAAARTAVQRISLALERAKKDLTYASANNSQTTAAVAIGYLAKSNNSYSTAVGPQSIVNSADSTALGRLANVSGANASSALAIGHDARVIGDTAVNATAIGTQSRIHHNAVGAIAFGSNSNIYGNSNNSIAIGTNAHISNNDRRSHGVYAVVENATVLGSFSTASANKGTAVGSNNTVIGASSGALGSDNTVGKYSSGIDTSTYYGTRSFVVGSNNTVTLANDTMVFGNNVAVTQANRSGSVILGNNSSVPENVTAINSAKVGNITYAGFAGNLGGTTTDGTSAVAADQGRFVSIGNAKAPRQIKHVAAGRIEADSTDAINGSQLYSLTGVVSNMGVSVANVIGGNAVLNPNGTINGFSRLLDTTGLADTTTYTKPTTAATNVATAITNLNDYVNAGWKIAQGDETDAKARISPDEQVNFKADGLASVTVEANATNKGADVTYTVTKGEFKDDTTDGTISAKTDKGDKAATVNDVSSAINRAYWKAKAAGNGVTTDTPDQVIAGTEVTFAAGKNLTVDHKTPKTFTFATVDTPNFKGVELVDKNATDDKKLTLTPTDAGDLELNKGLSNAAAKITNVVSGLAKFDVNNPLVGNGHTLEELTMSQDDAYSGLTNLADKNVQDNTAATVGDLRGMGWVVSSNKTTGSLSNEYTSQVKNANEVKFVGTGAAVVSGKTDDNTRTITVDVAKGELVNATTDAQTGNTVNANRGKVTVKSGDDNKVATVKNVADAINSAATIIKAVNEHDTAITDTDETKNDDGEVVKAGDDVTYKAGKNLRVKRDTRNLTFALANDITVNNANVDTKLTIGKTNPVGITSDTNGLNFATTEGTNTNAPVYLNGVKSTLQDTIVAAATPNLEKVDKDVTTFTAAEKARAASVQDVLNSGWNIRGKKQATDADVANVDFVRTYDTVDFISGDANTTEVTVNAKDDNKRTEVSIKAKTGETDVVTAADAGKKVGQVKAKANAGTTTDQGSNLATVNAVANAVNSAYWTAKAAGNGVTNDTPDQVTAGTEVTFKAGKNLAVDHSTANTFEFKTKDEVEFTSVQIGTDGPKLTKGDGNTLKVSAVDGTAPVKITNVAAGENDNDAVSYKQFKEIKAATDNTIKLTAIDNVKGTQNKTETTTSDQKLNQADGINFKLASADNDLLSVKAAGDTVTFTPKLGKVEITDGKAVEATSQTGLVEATELAEALNKLGWKTKATEAGSTANPVDQEINAGDSVNYEDGQGTTAKVEITKGATNPDTGISTPDTVSVKYDVKAADNTINVSDAGVKVNTGSIELAKTDEKANDRGKVTITPKAKVDGGTETQEEANKRAETEVATVKNVANAINSAATIIKAHNDNTEITDEVKDDKGETVKAGDDVTYTAGKNLRVKRDARNLTFALANEIEVEKATATKSLTIGEGDNTTTLTSDEDGLSVAGKNDAPRKVTNVAEGTETLVFDKEGNQLVEIGGKFYDTADIDDQGLPKADAKEKTPLKDTDTDADAYAKAASGLADLAGSDQTNALTVADAGKLGWVMSAGGNSTAVQNADEVIFNAKDGVNITSHFDANSGKYNVDFGLKVDEDADNILNVTEDGVSVLKGELEAAATTGTTRGKVTVKEADQTGDNQVATVNNVAEAINSAKWFAKAENLEEALTDRAQKDTDEEAAAIGAGDLIALKADKNLAVKREGTNFTYGLAKDIGVNSITLGTAETAVNLSSSAGALNVADKDGNTAQITNVKAGAEVVTFDKDGNQIVKKGDKYVTLDDAGNPTNIEATPATEEELAKLDPSQKALAGLADLYGSKGTNALTVEDARNLGWVVSAGDHSAAVTNTDEVVFEGTNGVDVSAKSENGVHTITVGIAQGKVDGNTTTGVATGDTNYVTGDQVAKAINESGWKTNVTQTNATTGATEIVTKVVTPGTQVNYVNGSGTNANVSANASTGGLDVTFDVKSANTDTLTVDKDGVKVNTGKITAADSNATITIANADGTTSTIDNPERGKVTVGEDQGNKVATVQNVADAINSAKWLASVEETGEEITTSTEEDTGVAIGAGDELSFKAGKNLKIKRDGQEITYALAKDIEVNSVTANNRVQIGSGDTAVNLTSHLGALKVADKDGKATQITNVDAGANTMRFNKDGEQLVQVGDKYYVVNPETGYADVEKESTPATEEELDKLAKAKPELKAYVAYAKAASGLADLDNSVQTNALTVADAQRLGWVVSASGNDYADSVTNANEVRFNGSNGISVTGETDEHGVRNINVSIAKGNVAGNTTTGVATGDTNYVTGDQVAKAINESGWKTNVTQTNATTGATETVTKVVTPGTQVNYVNGSGTDAKVSVNASTGGLDVTFDVKLANLDTLTVGKDGVKVNTGAITSADSNATITITNADGSTSTIDNPERGKVTVATGEGNKVATVQNVADAINSAKWFANAKNLDTAMTVRSEKGTESQAIGAGDTVTFQADKNLAVSRKEGVFTYGLAKDIGVNSVTLGTADTVVNLSSSAGALNVADKEGNAAQITNVKAGAEVVTFDKEGNQIVRKGDKYVTLDDAGHPTNIEATPATEEELAKLDPRQKALAGLADLYGSKGTNALTVEDARNLGWVVSAGDHSAAVTNTDEVVFEGINGVDVSAKSENGVHTITVGIKDGDVVKSNQFTAKVGGKDTPVIKVGDQYYKVEDIDPKTGAPKANVNAVTVDANTTPTNAGLGYVTGNKVADAIQQSGFVLGKQKAPLAASDYKDADVADEVVNPNDEVRFADGNNTKVKLATKESVDVTGNKVTTTTVKVDVNGLPVQYTTADGTPVTKVGDAFYKVDANGNPTGDVVDGATLVAKVINPTAKANEAGRSITLGNVANGAKTFDAAKDAEGNDLVKANDGLWHKATDVEANGALKPKASSATPVTSDSSAGLVDFTKSKPNNVATVGDLQNIGWVMSTSDNGYTDQVRNANKVDFKGGNGIEVKGKTLTDGTREITVAIKEGDVTKSNEFTAPDGTKLTKIGDNYYRQEDIDNHTGKPKSSEVKALYKAEGDKVFAIDQVTGNIKPSEEAKLVKKDNGYVTGNKVADAIAQSGWNIGLGDDAKASEAFADPTKALSANILEKVNPNDNLRFANGKNTKVSAATVESTDENGDKVTTTYVKTDVELPLGQLSATDTAGNKVVKGADGKWYPAKADGSADTAKGAVDGRTVRQETVLDPDNKGEKYKALTEQPTSADNNAISRAQSDALKDQKVVDAKAQLAKTLAQAGQSAEVITAALEGIDNAVRDEVKAKYLKDNGLDKGTAGSVITNVAWGQKPSDAVNVDQLQNSGWNLDSKAVAGTNGKVTTISTAATKVKMDETVNINAGQNIEITRHGKSVEIATSMNPNFDSVKLGKGNKAVTLNSTADGALSVEGAKVTNVAKGRITSGSTDAINGGQLYDVASQVSQHLGNLNHRINKVGKNADAGTASALAASQLPQAYIPGKSMVAVAGGTYQGQNGLALGVSRTSDNGKVIIRLSGTANSQGKKGVAAGIGYQW